MASFTPHIFACTSGASKLRTTCLKKLASFLSEKRTFHSVYQLSGKVQSSVCQTVGLSEKRCIHLVAYFLCVQRIGFTSSLDV